MGSNFLCSITSLVVITGNGSRSFPVKSDLGGVSIKSLTKSFFLFLRENDGEAELPRDLSGHRYKCHASVVDLDPKPVACVEKHRRRNAAMYEAFLAQQK